MQGKPAQPAPAKNTNVQANSPEGPLGSIYRDSSNGQMFTQDLANPNLMGNMQSAGNTMGSALQGLSGFGGNNGFNGNQDWLNYTNNLTNDYTKSATTQFMNQEQPVLNNMMQNYASRFGGSSLNQPYVDALSTQVQNTINPQLSQIAQQGALMGPQLTGQYIGQQGQLAGVGENVMNTNQGQWNNLMSGLGGLSTGANQFQTGIAGSNASMYNTNMNNYQNPMSFGASLIGGLGSGLAATMGA